MRCNADLEPARAARGSLLASTALSVCVWGCSYDLDKLYSYKEEVRSDGGADAGDEQDAALPEQLVDLWDEGALSAECVACAKAKCGDVSTSCRGDSDCAELTRCMAQAQDPADQYDCRAEHVSWLAEKISERDTGGPYHQCVFGNQCANECDSHAQLACVKQFDWPMTTATIPLHLRFVEGLNSLPVEGLKVRACRSEDPTQCLPADSPQYTTDANGEVHLEVQPSLGSFQGYLELTGAEIYPTLLRFGWPITRALVTSTAVVSTQNVNLLVATSEVGVEAGTGMVQLRAFGCNGISARDVSFALIGNDQNAATWYTTAQDLLPSFDATSTADRGAGGITNVEPGRRRFTASYNGELIASLSAPVRVGYMTVIVILPADSSL